MTSLETRTLHLSDADIVFDVRGPLPTADGRRPLFMVGQPMDATGFGTLRSLLPDHTVITYDPRGIGRSTRRDGRLEHVPEVQAEDVHGVIETLGIAFVNMFASSGGAVTSLALVTQHPGDVSVLVAHEPPLVTILPDAIAAGRALDRVVSAYAAGGFGAGMAAFITMTTWQGEFGDEYLARPAPDPVSFGLPREDDGARDNPLLSGRSSAVTSYRPDAAALTSAPTRIVIAVGQESLGTFTGRTASAMARLLGQEAAVFPSHHAGFAGGEFGYTGQPRAFADRLVALLNEVHGVVPPP